MSESGLGCVEPTYEKSVAPTKSYGRPSALYLSKWPKTYLGHVFFRGRGAVGACAPKIVFLPFLL